MINLIQHLWQLEISQKKIVPTIIKITNQPPKLYFYSEKQSKVLRKKQHSVQACTNYLRQSSQKSQQYLLMKISKNKNIQPSLILLNQVYAMIEKQEQCLAVLAIQWNSTIQTIYECKCNFLDSSFQTQLLMFKKQGVWQTEEKISQMQNNKIIEECLKMCNTLLLKLNITKKCTEFNVIVGTNRSSTDVVFLWCNTFKWNGQSFYQIDFDFQQIKLQKPTNSLKEKKGLVSQNEHHLKQQNFKCIKFQDRQSWGEKMFIEQQVIKLQNTQFQQCKGCENSTDKNTLKQVSFDDIISLRRHKKLSIKGISDDFAPVCYTCYMLLQQLQNIN